MCFDVLCVRIANFEHKKVASITFFFYAYSEVDVRAFRDAQNVNVRLDSQ
jgi:hypothetical protein